MTNVIRWALILPVGIGASAVAQFLVGFFSEFLPVSDFAQDRTAQVINSAVSAWAFVLFGAWIAPRGYGFRVAVGLAIMFAVFVLATVALSGGDVPKMVALSGMLGLATVMGTCIWIRRTGTGRIAGSALLATSVPIAWIGGTAIHIWTVVIAYEVGWLVAAVLSLMFPGLAQVYWFIQIWRESGTLANPYCVTVGLYLLALIGVMIGFAAIEDE